jgi:SAM-dependent methyltransferase
VQTSLLSQTFTSGTSPVGCAVPAQARQADAVGRRKAGKSGATGRRELFKRFPPPSLSDFPYYAFLSLFLRCNSGDVQAMGSMTATSGSVSAANGVMPRRLHLGCFDRAIDGWINTDVTPHLYLARVPLLVPATRLMRLMNEERYRQHQQGLFRKLQYLNVTKPFPFAADEFDCVYSSHMLEHIPKQFVPGVLKEIYRVLKPGAVVRTVVPDLDHFITTYDVANPDRFVSAVFQTEAHGAKNRHWWMYNGKSLCRLLSEHGFHDVTICQFQQGECPDIEKLDDREDHSLYVEAFKPRS